MTWPNFSPKLYAKFLNCQATSCTVEQNYSMQHKLLEIVAISPQIMFGDIYHYL